MSKGTAIFGMIVVFAIGFGVGYAIRGNVTMKAEKLTARGADADSKAKAGAQGKAKGLDAKAADAANPRYKVNLFAQTSPTKGPADAPVTIVEVSDFQCPYCSRAKRTVDALRKQYGDKIRLIWHNNPLSFHKRAMPAAIAALAAHEQGKFWEYHDKLFDNQKKLEDPDLERYAEELGLDVGKWKQAYDSKKFEGQIKREQGQAVRLGARGTPGFFINGRLLSGAQPQKKFTALIDLELEAAAALRTKGVPADKVYAELTKKGLTRAKKKPRKPRPREDPKAVYKVPVGDSPGRGAKKPLVTLVVFSEYQCPYCKKIEPTFAKLLDKYGKDLRIVWKDNPLPFHKRAMAASKAARAAGKQGKFWEYHDTLFDNQKKLEDPDLERYAKQLGLNMGKWKADYGSDAFDAAIKADMDLARQIGARGTPNSYVNGRKMTGAQPQARFEAVIDEEIAKAKALLKKGVSRAKLYQELTKGGSTKQVMMPLKMDVTVGQAPTKGPKDAKVTIIEFSDFQCPFCSRGAKTIDRVVKEYGDKVRVAFKQHPLHFHKDAFLAAEATLAAHEQGKFWEYHDTLWANQKALKRPDLERYAAELGLDLGKFKAALDSHKFAAQVKAETAEAETLGASGTPAFFINGIYLKGAKPFEEFKAVIDDELKKPARKPGAKIVPKMIPGGKGAPKVLKMAPRGPAKPTVKKAR